MAPTWDVEAILRVLDACCEAFTFPMLDNGYVYLAASRLSLHRSQADWAMVVEVFGFSPRAEFPDLNVTTFGSSLSGRRTAADFLGEEAFARFLRDNPHNEARFVHAIDGSDWLDPDDPELVARDASNLTIRGQTLALPGVHEFGDCGIELQRSPRVQVFELCRWLAAVHRELVLAAPAERRACVPAALDEVLVLDEWRHPDLVNGERPGSSPTFRQLAEVLVKGDSAAFRNDASPNTHWSNWPLGGTL
ncbi:MAG: hypothetical protein H6835_15630 [Planctomycetes bacterium]|nr:hypothetical protein [Planctomycetota bacterium]